MNNSDKFLTILVKKSHKVPLCINHLYTTLAQELLVKFIIDSQQLKVSKNYYSTCSWFLGDDKNDSYNRHRKSGCGGGAGLLRFLIRIIHCYYYFL